MKSIFSYLIKYKDILFILFLALLSIWPLLHGGLIPTHDGEYHLIRFYEFDKMLRNGDWYPRWAPDLDFSYGLPLFTFVYPLPNYVASLLHACGASFLDSVKLVMAIATFIGGIFVYLWTKEFWGKLGGTIATTVYLFAPYRFVDMYVRGSVGEVMALSVFPGFLWSYIKFVKTKKPIYFVLSSAFLALTIFSHNILGLMFFSFAISYVCFFIIQDANKKQLLIDTSYLLLLSLGLSSIFWIPALTETKFVTGLQIFNISQNFPDLSQLLFPSWGSGFFDSNLGNEMSVQIGLANSVALIVGLIAAIQLWKHKKENKGLVLFFLAWFVILFCFMLPFTLSLWQTIPLIHYFQFPWRLLSLVILVCSFLAGSVALLKPSKILACLFILFAILTTISYTHPAYYMMRSDLYYTSRSNFIDSTNSPGNAFNTIWNTVRTKRPDALFAANKDVSFSNVENIALTNFSATVNAKYATAVSANISYFPGWQVTIDGNTTQVKPDKHGLLSFSIPEGIHSLTIQLKLTTIETIAQYITLLSTLIVLSFLLRKKIK